MSRPLGSPIATTRAAKRLASGGAHAAGRHGKAAHRTKKDIGNVRIFLWAGTVLHIPKGPLPPSYVNACTSAPGGPQEFRATFTMLDGRHISKRRITSGEASINRLPIGRYRVNVENVSSVPSLPDTIAEIVVRRQTSVRLDVVHSTDTLGAIADTCGFRIGSLGSGTNATSSYADVQRAELNSTAVGTFWPEFVIGDAVVGGGSVAPLTDATSRTVAAQPGQIAVIEAATRKPLMVGGANVFGQRDNASSPTQLTLVNGAGQPVSIATGTRIRFRAQAPTPDYVHYQYTPIVWKSFGYPPDWDDKHPIVGDALLARVLKQVDEALGLLPQRPGDQFVLVNETLKNGLGWSDLLRGSLGKRFSSGSVGRNPRRLFDWLSRHEADRDALFARCLAQNGAPEGRWLRYLHDSGPRYIRESFERAHAARSDGAYIINDFGVESLALPKAVALVVLAAYLKEKLGAAGRTLGVGLQMHMTPTSVPYQPRRKRLAFLRGLRAMLRAVARLHANVYVTEMAARMPGPLSSFEERRTKADLYQAVLQLNTALGQNDPEAVSFASTLMGELGYPPLGNESPSAKGARLVAEFQARAEHAADHAVQADLAKEQASENARAKRRGRRAERIHFSKEEISSKKGSYFAHLSGQFPSDRPWSNVRIWQSGPDPAYLAGIQPLPAPSARDHKTQKEMFRDVVLACLGEHNCNDLNFWEMLDHPWGDDSTDLLGHACDENVGGPAPAVPAPSKSWRRKPAFYGALQGAIEAALAKHRLEDYARSQNRTSRTATLPSFTR